MVWFISKIGAIPTSLFSSVLIFLKLKRNSFPKIYFRFPKIIYAETFQWLIEFFQSLSGLILMLFEALRWFIEEGLVKRIVKLKKAKKKHRGRKKVGWVRRFKRILPSPIKLGIGLTLIISGFFFYSFFLVNLAQQLPNPEKLLDMNGPLTTTFYDRSGSRVLYRLYQDKNRQLVKLDDLPPQLLQATLAIEDKNFYNHPGVDIGGITRAAWGYIQTKKIQGGGSTITQQLIKNTLLTPDKTFKRKLKEVILAFWAERIFTKNEILKMYFNEVPYGGSIWGIASASQVYFDKAPKDLKLNEIAYLAGLPASPTTYSPYGNNPQLGKDRQREVLRRMVEDGYINEAEAERAFEEPISIKAPLSSIKAPHFVMYTKDILAQKYGEKVLSQGGLKIVTSLDLDIQQTTEEIVSEEVDKLQGLNVGNGAAMVTDPRSGQVLAMVGSKNYWDGKEGNFNVATSPRQPGSSIKPITYATGFKQGFLPGTMLLDAPVAYRNAWEIYAPVNYDNRFHGVVTARTALGSSYNIPAVKMLSMVGIDNMLQTAHEMGITTLNDRDRYGLSLTLGGGEVKLTDMMVVYGTFSQMGVRHDLQPVLQIIDSQGRIIEDNQKTEGERVLPDTVAYLVNDVLADNKARTPAFGPNSLLNIPGHTVSVKTGTTDNKRDNWCFGFTPEFVVGVWVGNNNNAPMDPRLTSGITGASPIWNRIMIELVKDRPNLAFERPKNVVEGLVNGQKELVVSNQPGKPLAKERPYDPNGKPVDKTITFTDPFNTFTVQGATKN